METQRKKFGGNLAIGTEKSKQKSLDTRYDKYNTFSPNSCLFKSREYLFPSGNKVFIQGYEDKALEVLLQTYKEEEIEVCGKKHMFRYFIDRKNKRYYPDFFIKMENLYIDVKSVYTYRIDLNKNIAKKNSVKDYGFNFQFWIFEPNGNLTILS